MTALPVADLDKVDLTTREINSPRRWLGSENTMAGEDLSVSAWLQDRPYEDREAA